MVFIAACLQMRSTRSVQRNIAQFEGLAREAIAKGATFLQSPEMSNIIERSRKDLFAALSVEAGDPFLKAASDLARSAQVEIHLGSLAIREGEKIANRGFLIGRDGQIKARYDKLHLFDVDLPNGESWKESATYTAGACGVVAPLEAGGVLGMGICYDLRFPALFHALAGAGATMLSAPACFTKQTGQAHWTILQRARAIETGSFMISAAQGGLHEDGRETFGHSLIVAPWGAVLAEAGDEPGVIIADIDLQESAEARQRIPTLAHARAIRIAEANQPAHAERGAA